MALLQRYRALLVCKSPKYTRVSQMYRNTHTSTHTCTHTHTHTHAHTHTHTGVHTHMINTSIIDVDVMSYLRIRAICTPKEPCTSAKEPNIHTSKEPSSTHHQIRYREATLFHYCVHSLSYTHTYTLSLSLVFSLSLSVSLSLADQKPL